MTIVLELPPGTEAAIQQEAARQGTTPERLALHSLQELYPDVDIDAALAALRSRPSATSVDALTPRAAPPPGTNGMEYVIGQWPGEETDEEMQAALEALE